MNYLVECILIREKQRMCVCVCAGINSGLAHSKCHVAIYMYACLRLRDHGTEGENQYPWDVPDNKNVFDRIY